MDLHKHYTYILRTFLCRYFISVIFVHGCTPFNNFEFSEGTALYFSNYEDIFF